MLARRSGSRASELPINYAPMALVRFALVLAATLPEPLTRESIRELVSRLDDTRRGHWGRVRVARLQR